MMRAKLKRVGALCSDDDLLHYPITFQSGICFEKEYYCIKSHDCPCYIWNVPESDWPKFKKLIEGR